MIGKSRSVLASLVALAGILTVVLGQASSGLDVVVRTAEGDLRGKEVLIENSPVHAFLGVRYVEAPARWKRPVARKEFPDLKDARFAGSVCPQLDAKGNFTGDEDCLFLDIIVGGISSHRKKAVLVYISNENQYQTGTSHTGAMLAKREKLVVVVVHSRLGALGYMHNGPGTSNLGLWDNLFALSWIQRNIGAFGGNSSRVTIMGVDSGATIAQLLSASPHSEGLFHQVIAMSPLNTNFFGLQPLDDKKQMLKIFEGCSPTDSVTCNTSNSRVEDIVRYITSSRPNIYDKDLYPNGFSRERLERLNYLSGVTSAEELLLTNEIVQIQTKTTNGTITQEVIDDITKSICEAAFKDVAAQCLCVNSIKTRFQVDDRSPYPLREVESIISALLHSQVIDVLRDHAKASAASTYAYNVNIREDLQLLGLPENARLTGSDKSIMLKLAFGYPFLAFGDKFYFLNRELYNNQLLTEIEPMIMFGGRVELRPQSQDVMRYWANFVKTGNPGRGVRDMMWPRYGTYSPSFLTLDNTLIVKIYTEFRAVRAYEYFNSFFYKSIGCIATHTDSEMDTAFVGSTVESTTIKSVTVATVHSTVVSQNASESMTGVSFSGTESTESRNSTLAQIIFGSTASAGNLSPINAPDVATTSNIMPTSSEISGAVLGERNVDDSIDEEKDATTTASSTDFLMTTGVLEINTTTERDSENAYAVVPIMDNHTIEYENGTSNMFESSTTGSERSTIGHMEITTTPADEKPKAANAAIETMDNHAIEYENVSTSNMSPKSTTTDSMEIVPTTTDDRPEIANAAIVMDNRIIEYEDGTTSSTFAKSSTTGSMEIVPATTDDQAKKANAAIVIMDNHTVEYEDGTTSSTFAKSSTTGSMEIVPTTTDDQAKMANAAIVIMDNHTVEYEDGTTSSTFAESSTTGSMEIVSTTTDDQAKMANAAIVIMDNHTVEYEDGTTSSMSPDSSTTSSESSTTGSMEMTMRETTTIPNKVSEMFAAAASLKLFNSTYESVENTTVNTIAVAGNSAAERVTSTATIMNTGELVTVEKVTDTLDDDKTATNSSTTGSI